MDDTVMKQAEAEDWGAEVSEAEGQGLAGGSRRAGKRLLVQVYWRETTTVNTQPSRKNLETMLEA